MKLRFTHVCLLCVVVLATGEEHEHGFDHHEVEINKSARAAKMMAVKPDPHADHGHNDEEGHNHDHNGDGHHDHKGHERDDGEPEQHHLDFDEAAHINDFRIWLAATGAIIAIALCGIFGVLIIPLMQQVFYQHLIQFLIALAVGTLVGDALLHLLPHAVISKLELGHNPAIHDSAVWLGFVSAGAMVAFFVFEKVVMLVGEWRDSKRKERKVRVIREGHMPSEKAVGDRLCKSKYSTHCINDFDLGESELSGGNCEERRELKPNGDVSDHDTVIISQHEVSHHGHSHAHSHLHSAPRNISSVAWMVICGDGIHNLADGLAIGAAFAAGYMSGLSTSVAVLCHELPHEIGDFAMLIKAGMTIKQAIFYNVLSSFLAMVGMVFGLLVGASLPQVTPWLFSATAGVFLYVALVDMMPELSSGHAHPISKDHQKETRGLALFLQVLGMSAGICIMLLIALFEHDLKEAIGGDAHFH